jgi:hypothetical protein
VIVNPAGAYVGRSKVDDHKNSELTCLLEPLAHLADKHRTTIVLVCHLTKGMGAKAVHRIMGGAGYVNSARAAFILGFDPEDEDRRVLARAKGNCGPVPPARAFRIKNYDQEAQFALQEHEKFGHLSDEDRSIIAGQLIRVEWDQGNVALSADDVVGRDGQNSNSPSKVEQAGDWLMQFLDQGPRESDEIFAAGLKVG